MRFRLGLITLMVFAVSISARATAPIFYGGASNLVLSEKTEVPGTILKPGTYTIEVFGQLADRVIVRVDSTTSKDHAIFIGVPSSSLTFLSGTGPVTYFSNSKGVKAMRGFHFALHADVEFVYPKSEAVRLAKANSTRVFAVDPESQGMSPAIKGLSQDGMRVVNLWLLSMTTTGIDNKTPAVLAQRLPDKSAATEPVVARTEKAADAKPVHMASLAPDEQESRVWDPVPAKRRGVPPIARLPKTGSFQPLIWLLGLFSFAGAMIVSFSRISTTKA